MNILAIISVLRTMGYDSELTFHPREQSLSWPAPGCPSKWGPLPRDHLARVWLVFLRVSPALQLLVLWDGGKLWLLWSRAHLVSLPHLVAFYSVLFSCSLPMMAGAFAVSTSPSHPLNAQLGG